MDELRYDVHIAAEGRVLVDVRDFRIPRDRITLLFGESGIGKSLIARAIYGLLDPEELDVTVNGEQYERYLGGSETAAIRTGGFFVFQEPSSHLNPLLPLGAQLREGSLAPEAGERAVLRGLWEREEWELIEGLLHVYPKPYRPSGGEKQRMFLAMALKKIDLVLDGKVAGAEPDTALFVFDEPTGSLDNQARNTFLSLLFSRYRRQHCTILVITHDYSLISEVNRSHGDLLPHLSFNELRRRDGHVEVRGFEAQTYTGWLNERGRRPLKGPPAGEPVLTVESSLEVFGRRLTITRDPDGKQPVSLSVDPGTMAYLKAPSGVGKTTVMKMLVGLVRGQRLRMKLRGLTLDERTDPRMWRKNIWGKRMTMVFQHADEALNPRSRVREILEGLPGQVDTGVAEVTRRLGELFEAEPGVDFLDRRVSALSGGQKQRLNLVRGLALQTDMLLLDEPLNGLDFDSITRVISVLEQKQAAGLGILMVSHNEEIVETMIHGENLYYLHAS
jgi:peptide/nickel transport system ATP-binding protein